MNHFLNKKYILISLLIHVVIIMLLSYFIRSNRIGKTFLVFGAHSQKPSHAYMKFAPQGVPFVGKRPAGGASRGSAAPAAKGSVGSATSAGAAVRQTPQKASSGGQAVRKRSKGRPSFSPRTGAGEVKTTSFSEHIKIGKAGNVDVVMRDRVKKLAQLDKKTLQKNKDHRQALLQERQQRLDAYRQQLADREKKVAVEADVKKDEVDKPEPVVHKEVVKKIKQQIPEVATKAQDAEPIAPEVAQDIVQPKVLDAPQPVVQQTAAEVVQAVNATPAELPASPAASENQSAEGDFFTPPASGVEGGNEVLDFSLIGEANQDLRVFHASIQKEVSRLWMPPPGVAKGTTCRGLFVINKIGEVEHFEFVQKSKVPIYNWSILQIAKKCQFDACLWGKRFTVEFCQ